MKIQYIQISNVLSFKHYEDLFECPKIEFSSNSDKDIHILIGPNGAGKSNLSENVYILKHGELEDYLAGIKDKSIPSIIDFCHDYNEHPLQEQHKKEIDEILDKIFDNQASVSQNEIGNQGEL